MPLPSMAIEVEAIQLQNQINALPETRMDDPDSETRMAERHALMIQLDETRLHQIAALRQEDQEGQAAMALNINTDGWTPERREFRALAQRTSIGNYVLAAAEGREIREGAEFEYNQHVLGTFSQGDFPMEMLLDRAEVIDLTAEHFGQLRHPVGSEEFRAEVTGVAGHSRSIHLR